MHGSVTSFLLFYRKLFLIFILSVSCIISASAQKQAPENLPKFDKRRHHFGFILAYNSADFIYKFSGAFPTSDSVLSVLCIRQPGFDLGPLVSLNLNQNISLRFIPTLSFQDRRLEYSVIKDTTTELHTKRVESTFINLPLNLKLRTDRINNFAGYAVFGFQYSIDMASQEHVENNTGPNSIVKIRRTDKALQVGGGMDFFFPYFKFGIELKLSKGMDNLLIQDNNMYTTPFSSLRSKVWLLSFTFEG
jgi:hypothetical protein